MKRNVRKSSPDCKVEVELGMEVGGSLDTLLNEFKTEAVIASYFLIFNFSN